MRGCKTSDTVIQDCVLLRQQGFSLGEICRRTRLSKTTVFQYIKTVPLLPLQLAQLRQNTRIATQYSNRLRKGKSRLHNRIASTPSPQLNASLVSCLAHFLFDGSVHNHQVCYYNRSSHLVNRQQKLVKKFFFLNGKIYPQATGVLRLTYDSVELVGVIKLLQSQLLAVIKDSPPSWKRAFLKAFFNDEGCIYLSTDRRMKRVSGFQKDVAILDIIQILLNDFSIKTRIYCQENRVASIIVASNFNNLKKFHREINFSSGVTLNPQRKNSRYTYAIEKKELLKQALASYRIQ